MAVLVWFCWGDVVFEQKLGAVPWLTCTWVRLGHIPAMRVMHCILPHQSWYVTAPSMTSSVHALPGVIVKQGYALWACWAC